MIVIRGPKTEVESNWIYHKKQLIFRWEWNKKQDWTIISKYKHGCNMHKHGKKAKRTNHINLFLTCCED